MPGRSAVAISLSEKQRNYLEQLCRRQKSPRDLQLRAKIILKAAEGLSNQAISDCLESHRITVRKWRGRWSEAAAELTVLEEKGETKELQKAIASVLADAYRRGTPPTFSSEQVVQIIALACEAPSLSNRPISHWTAHELADEATKRGIVESISPQTVERFLKGSRVEAASIPLLAEQRTRSESRGF
jgi:transposase